MENEKDTYKTIFSKAEAVYKEKGSKFLSFAYHIETEEEADNYKKEFKKKYYDATHVVYAFRLGYNGEKFRASDDGEPSGSSGIPVYNQIRSKELTNVIVLVVRYFGGTKLGIPGLINAYGQAAAMALETAEIQEVLITKTILIETSYAALNYVMRIVKEHDLQVLELGGDSTCIIKIAVRKNIYNQIVEILNKNGKITID